MSDIPHSPLSTFHSQLSLAKVLDIYATSVDYQPDTEQSQQFFATVQNKMHWATHGHTAAEIIAGRADADKPFMGLQTMRPGGIVRKDDIAVAKNYLTENELQVLNRIVNLYIEYAELQALERNPMTMRDWIVKLDEFMKISGCERLDHAGQISALTRGRLAGFSIDRLLRFLMLLGHDIEITVRSRSRSRARLLVA